MLDDELRRLLKDIAEELRRIRMAIETNHKDDSRALYYLTEEVKELKRTMNNKR